MPCEQVTWSIITTGDLAHHFESLTLLFKSDAFENISFPCGPLGRPTERHQAARRRTRKQHLQHRLQKLLDALGPKFPPSPSTPQPQKLNSSKHSVFKLKKRYDFPDPPDDSLQENTSTESAAEAEDPLQHRRFRIRAAPTTSSVTAPGWIRNS